MDNIVVICMCFALQKSHAEYPFSFLLTVTIFSYSYSYFKNIQILKYCSNSKHTTGEGFNYHVHLLNCHFGTVAPIMIFDYWQKSQNKSGEMLQEAPVTKRSLDRLRTKTVLYDYMHVVTQVFWRNVAIPIYDDMGV